MRIGYFCLIGITCFVASVFTQEEDQVKALLRHVSESEILYFQKFVEGNNRFGFDLYRYSRQQPGSVFLSTYSIAAGLGMVEIGAKGKTEQQFQQVFRYSPALLLFVGDLNRSLEGSHSNRGTEVLIPNALWLDKSISILPSYKQTMLRNFRANVEFIDFVKNMNQSVQTINQWTLRQSKGKINQIISSQDITSDMRMVLTTAAYLKGEWVFPFDQKLTKRLPFQVSKQRALTTDMMQNTAQYLLAVGESENVIVVPLKEEEETQIAMVIVLPQQGIDLSELEKKFNWENWLQWKSQLKSRLVTLTLPQFRIERRLDLEIHLKMIGLSSAFGPEADFSGISNQKELYLNQCFHKASINVHEKGINANEFGMVKMGSNTLNGRETPYEFVADHPFLFMIWDKKTDLILFMGRLSTP